MNTKLLSHFTNTSILEIDEIGKILDTTFNSIENLKPSSFKTIFEIFDERDSKRIVSLNNEGYGYRKRIQLKDERYVNVKIGNVESKRYIYIENIESEREEELKYEDLKNIAEKDPMTQIFNRFGGWKRIKEWIVNGDEEKRIGIIFMDMDNLKTINDTQGHDMGDKTIKGISGLILSMVRNRDIALRFGGDEFLIIVEEISGKESTTLGLAKRLQKIVNDSKEKYMTTISMGVHVTKLGTFKKYINSEEELIKKWEEEISKADKAVYESKKKGKNQISVTKGFSKYYKL